MRERMGQQCHDFWLPLNTYCEVGRDDTLILVATTMRLLLFEIYIGGVLRGVCVVLFKHITHYGHVYVSRNITEQSSPIETAHFFATRDLLDSSAVFWVEGITPLYVRTEGPGV